MRLLQRAHKETTLHQHKNRRKAEVEQKHLFVKLKEQNKASFGSDMARKGLGNSTKERKKKKETKQENKKKGKTKKREKEKSNERRQEQKEREKEKEKEKEIKRKRFNSMRRLGL